MSNGCTVECPHCYTELEARRNDPDIVLSSGVIVDITEISGDDPKLGHDAYGWNIWTFRMIEQKIDLWEAIKDAPICITTNGTVKKNGAAVMGAGCAKETEGYLLLIFLGDLEPG